MTSPSWCHYPRRTAPDLNPKRRLDTLHRSRLRIDMSRLSLNTRKHSRPLTAVGPNHKCRKPGWCWAGVTHEETAEASQKKIIDISKRADVEDSSQQNQKRKKNCWIRGSGGCSRSWPSITRTNTSTRRKYRHLRREGAVVMKVRVNNQWERLREGQVMCAVRTNLRTKLRNFCLRYCSRKCFL